MALLFQANPDNWDLREALDPVHRSHDLWLVTRYFNFMHRGRIVLLWSAKGSLTDDVCGLYGWGITEGDPHPDNQGNLRIRVEYMERWIGRSREIAAIRANELLGLRSWQEHLLSKMRIGTNFLVTPRQLEDLDREIIQLRFRGSAFGSAVKSELSGVQLDSNSFNRQEIREVTNATNE